MLLSVGPVALKTIPMYNEYLFQFTGITECFNCSPKLNIINYQLINY